MVIGKLDSQKNYSGRPLWSFKNTVTIENINEDPKLKALEGHPFSVIFTNPDGDCCFMPWDVQERS